MRETSARQDGSRVLLGFEQAGTAFQDWLLALLANSKPMPVAFLRVSLDDKAKWENQAVTSDVMLPVLLKELGGRVLDTFRNTSTEFDLVVAGDTDPVRTVVNRLLKSDLKEGALGQCEVSETFPVLNEPQIVFQIRKGVRWHDGKPFTARDVEFTYRMLVDEKVASPRRPDFELVKRVEMADDWTVRIVYRKPYAPCLISWSMGMLPQHILDGKDTAWWAQNFNRNPIGTGPYKFDAWKTSEYVRMRRNEDYWEGKPHIEWVTIRVIPDMVALRLLFETGEIDDWGVEPHANKKFREEPLAFYNDKHSIFRVNNPQPVGTTSGLTQFGRAMQELDFEIICASTPQAKGRVERVNQTLQDRLVKELRLRGISTIEEANAYLEEFREDFNCRFAVAPRSSHNAHRPLRPADNLDFIFTKQKTGVLSKNLTLQYQKTIYQIQTNADLPMPCTMPPSPSVKIPKDKSPCSTRTSPSLMTPGGGRIIACLAKESDKLTPACKKVLAAAEKK